MDDNIAQEHLSLYPNSIHKLLLEWGELKEIRNISQEIFTVNQVNFKLSYFYWAWRRYEEKYYKDKIDGACSVLLCE